MFRALLRRRNSGPAVPTWGLAFFIQSSFKFVPYLLLTSTRNTIFTKFSSFLNQICLYGELQKSIGFTVNLLRMCMTMCFALPASQGCPSDPRSCAGHTMWSNAGALSSSACSPGDMPSQVPRGRVRDFSAFESQTTEGNPDETGWSPLPGLHSCDYESQCQAVGRGTFQPMLHCKMTCSVTGQLCSGWYHACCLTQQETQASIPVLPPNHCGLPQCILVNRRETPKQKFADSVGVVSIHTDVISLVDPEPSGETLRDQHPP